MKSRRESECSSVLSRGRRVNVINEAFSGAAGPEARTTETVLTLFDGSISESLVLS